MAVPKKIVQYSFFLSTILTLVLFTLQYRRDGKISSSLVISIGLLATYWYLSREQVSPGTLATGHALILLNALGAGFALFSWQLAGVTFDTYLHLLGGYATTLLLLERRSPGAALTYTMVLGIGVEIVELVEAWRLGALCVGWCPWWQDTAKDLLNDALGAAFALLPGLPGQAGSGGRPPSPQRR